ncbi:hypothetical protein F5884DRAFT_381540 [Xylogone sp. PMI_703]|nr:hypothetical protein F5884DRAFT_381540 [Xylogone sp. PMI_703]
MLRRSASQIFGDSTPQKQWAAAMSSSSSSFSPPTPSPPPHYQDAELSPQLPHTSAFASSSNTAAPSSSSSSPSPPSLTLPLPMLPRTQIQAMPPSLPAQDQRSHREIEAAWSQFPSSTMIPDPSTRHPVFFTERLKRAPNGVGAGAWISPVAAGYVFESQDVRRREENARL